MALISVRIRLGDAWHTLTYNHATGRYEGILIPDKTSAGQPGGYYSLEAEAVNDSGKRYSISGELMPGLRMVVRELAAPSLVLRSPPAGYLSNARPEFVLYAQDDPGGSGVDTGTFAVVLDGMTAAGTVEITQLPARYPLQAEESQLVWADAAGVLHPLIYAPVEYGCLLRWTPAEALSDGAHTITFSVQDRDGNPSSVSAAYTVDTVPPTLELTAPDSRRVVDQAEIVVSGWAADSTSGVAGIAVRVNGASVPAGGDADYFSAAVPLSVGGNDIVITATDSAGLVVSRTLRILRMVTNRTQADVDRLKSMFQRGEQAWTAEERNWFDSAGSHMGGYDSLDTNRVTEAIEILRGWLEQYGYAAGAAPSWPYPAGGQDVLTLPRDAAYCGQIRALRKVLPVPPETPQSPATLRRQGIKAANDIEKILVAVDAMRPLVELGPWWPCGTINCGGVF